MLCLSNGERIKLAKTMHMMFEVNDLSVASPATVSRCGMVFMEAVYIGLQPYIQSWTENVLPKKLPQHGPRLSKLLTKYGVPAIEFTREECREGTASSDAQLLRSCFNLLDATLIPAYGVQQGKGGVENMINLWVLFCFIWAFGGNLHDTSRSKFDAYVRECGIMKELDPNFPADGTIFDYCVSPEHGSFVAWTSLTTPFSYTKGTSALARSVLPPVRLPSAGVCPRDGHDCLDCVHGSTTMLLTALPTTRVPSCQMKGCLTSTSSSQPARRRATTSFSRC